MLTEEDFTHHGDEGAEGQSADGGHDAAQSQQAERTETSPSDRTVCTKTKHTLTKLEETSTHVWAGSADYPLSYWLLELLIKKCHQLTFCQSTNLSTSLSTSLVTLSQTVQVCRWAGVCRTFVVLSEAVTPQQVDAVGRSHVQVDVLQVEQDREQQRPLQVLRLTQEIIIYVPFQSKSTRIPTKWHQALFTQQILCRTWNCLRFVPAGVLPPTAAGNQTRSRYTGNEYLRKTWRKFYRVHRDDWVRNVRVRTVRNEFIKSFILQTKTVSSCLHNNSH